MKRILLTIALLAPAATSYANNFNMPWNNNNNNNGASNWNMPWNNNNGSSMSMPNMNWGNNNGSANNGFSNGSNWNMPNMNWGNNNGSGFSNGSNWKMPSMNWGNGNNNGYGSNWNMPNMNMGNNGNGFGNGSNWEMPSMNWGNNNQPWSGGQTQNYTYMPRALVQQPRIQPQMPVAPQFIPRPNINANAKPAQATMATPKVSAQATMPKSMQMQHNPAKLKKMPASSKIPMPSEVKGVILAPENMPKKAEATKQQ